MFETKDLQKGHEGQAKLTALDGDIGEVQKVHLEGKRVCSPPRSVLGKGVVWYKSHLQGVKHAPSGADHLLRLLLNWQRADESRHLEEKVEYKKYESVKKTRRRKVR